MVDCIASLHIFVGFPAPMVPQVQYCLCPYIDSANTLYCIQVQAELAFCRLLLMTYPSTATRLTVRSVSTGTSHAACSTARLWLCGGRILSQTKAALTPTKLQWSPVSYLLSSLCETLTSLHPKASLCRDHPLVSGTYPGITLVCNLWHTLIPDECMPQVLAYYV